MKQLDILETCRQKIAEGDLKGAEDFLIEHFKELPKELQGDLLIEFIKQAGSGNRLEHMATDTADAAMKTLDRIEKLEKELAETPEN
ncbi:MAG: hypothetical protein UY39_C0038G0004 [Candidatus Kaiserbacteria bacterium GW2011_GWC2_49_12]|uniref:Uncharacterized protein n=4 Tax=Candidatus Kaiseribacteriota TaxID=1752734 RepID=A0A0G1YPP3_9BACT|nr:MAG: hypothetical protein UY39_C0038G0004 [Candidatus Kaiserbacteria bacterium GW2011_GWC2_49_12]KKW16972.1 MAG: hypothetical protein UY57_C0028G0005 [Candidatus Kaiserbacteria bacterium GW2011_GWB1_50_17]KKW17816.1 MAG: hypothetical protein UY59_C0025G0005 [Candidatus Kaiserbacteria bacterium GW2011_GWA1_50_28]OGG87340.1 MAG: hypothetical protein A3H15_01540 [Candidatus Kaiserbacteria bacterium RIFCSPLOWO2_12_FULL_50_28]HCM43711.1 hypothetical protein [Candidatus Kaiserbacteria bacterium]